MKDITIYNGGNLADGTQSMEALFSRWVSFIDVRPRSAETYTKAVKRFLRWMRERGITQPTREDILSYRRYLSVSMKPTTVQTYIVSMRQFFLWLNQESLYPNVAANVKGTKIDRQHKKDYLTSEQIKAILSGIDRSSLAGKRDYAIVALMVTGGLRDAEVSRADVDDVRALGDGMVLYIQGKGRDEKTDYVKLVLPVEKAIRAYLKERGKTTHDAALFASTSNNSRGGRLSTRSISGIVKARMQEAGYDSARMTAHSLRHSAATLNLLGGATLEETQQLLRHNKIETTLIYAHHLDRDKNKSEERIASAIF